ncbi:MAG: hypothetical protein VXZ82_07285 [Planctomycetota bacterium]|nr:hypothetical protein [Planctomycetota bacterium]
MELIRQSAEVWENAEVEHWYHWTDSCQVALEELPAFEKLTMKPSIFRNLQQLGRFR